MTLKLSDDWRIVHDPLQWILQRRQGSRWRDRSFCVNRASLIRCIREHVGEAYTEKVRTFPEWHPDRVAGATKAAPPTEMPKEGVSALLPVSEGAGAA